MLLIFLLTGCSEEKDTTDYNTPRTVITDRESYEVTYTPTPDPIPLDEEFDLLLSISSITDSTLNELNVETTAEMPTHNHGMVQEPTVTMNEDGTFLAEGFLFHMSGPWELYVYVSETLEDGTTNVEQATFEINCCQ
ncbi:MAG: hypothetical protein CMK59_12535 [Proteobacteria bacterium]|nr:hypothetical protein [Pseudomonadota bacterium]